MRRSWKNFSRSQKRNRKPSCQNIDESLPFELKSDASDVAIASALHQANRPVVFFSRILYGSELKYPTAKKEACAIIEAIRYWKHYLTGCSIWLITDQKSASFMLNPQNKKKIKNDKIYRWRTELSCYNFDIFFCPGKDDIAADDIATNYIIHCVILGLW